MDICFNWLDSVLQSGGAVVTIHNSKTIRLDRAFRSINQQVSVELKQHRHQQCGVEFHYQC